jgi:hypothetical protein
MLENHYCIFCTFFISLPMVSSLVVSLCFPFFTIFGLLFEHFLLVTLQCIEVQAGQLRYMVHIN